MTSKKKLLIVDDKKVNRYVLSSIFEEKYDIQECEDGAQAISVLADKTTEMAAVLLDVVMPECNGFHVLEYMRKEQLDSIPVIMISSTRDDEMVKKGFELQVSDFIQKPFDDEIVQKRVEYVIECFEKKRSIDLLKCQH